MIPAKIKKLGQKHDFKRGELIFSSGEEADGFYFVLSGEIRLYNMDEEGHEISIASFGAGSFIGEVILFASEVYPANAEATKDTAVVFFSKSAMNRAIDGDPALAHFFLHLLARKCMTLNRRLESISLKSIRQRLLEYLREKCAKDGTCVIELNMSKTQLAKHLGTISETLSRNLAQLQNEGMIEVRGKQITIKKCGFMAANENGLKR